VGHHYQGHVGSHYSHLIKRENGITLYIFSKNLINSATF
jgi:hypothetical protein